MHDCLSTCSLAKCEHECVMRSAQNGIPIKSENGVLDTDKIFIRAFYQRFFRVILLNIFNLIYFYEVNKMFLARVSLFLPFSFPLSFVVLSSVPSTSIRLPIIPRIKNCDLKSAICRAIRSGNFITVIYFSCLLTLDTVSSGTAYPALYNLSLFTLDPDLDTAGYPASAYPSY